MACPFRGTCLQPVVKYSNNQILSQVNLHKQFIFIFSFLTFSEKYNTFCKYLHYQTILLVEKRYINRKNQTKKPAAGAARILIFYSSPTPLRNPKKRDKGGGGSVAKARDSQLSAPNLKAETEAQKLSEQKKAF